MAMLAPQEPFLSSALANFPEDSLLEFGELSALYLDTKEESLESSSDASVTNSPSSFTDEIWESVESLDPDPMDLLVLEQVGESPPKAERFSLLLSGLPEKSRVETQISICVQLVDESGQLVNNYRFLKLPPHLLVPEKLKSKFPPGTPVSEAPIDAVKLQAMVVRGKEPSQQILRCFRCIKRERKARQRRWQKIQQRSTATDKAEPSPLSLEQEQLQILQFYSTTEYVNFSTGEAILSARVSCYSSHHQEKSGFRIAAQLISPSNERLATGVSSLITICDFHKSEKRKRTAVTSNGGPNKRTVIRQVSLVEKTVPEEGPTTGGVEVSVLGKNFSEDTVCYFGEMPAITTSKWGSTALTCILPPSNVTGPVQVSVAHQTSDQAQVFFTYQDGSQHALAALLLQVLGDQLPTTHNTQALATQIQAAYNSVFPQQSSSSPHSASPLTDTATRNILTRLSSLFESSLNLRLRDKIGRNLLHHAAILGFRELASYLNRVQPALLHQQDQQGNTPLHYACLYSHPTLVKLFLSHSPKQLHLDATNCLGQSPLHMACQAGQDFIVASLLQAGASIHVEDFNDETPVDYARRHNPTLLPTVQQSSPSIESSSSLEIHYQANPFAYALVTSIIARYQSSLASRVLVYLVLGLTVGVCLMALQGTMPAPNAAIATSPVTTQGNKKAELGTIHARSNSNGLLNRFKSADSVEGMGSRAEKEREKLFASAEVKEAHLENKAQPLFGTKAHNIHRAEKYRPKSNSAAENILQAEQGGPAPAATSNSRTFNYFIFLFLMATLFVFMFKDVLTMKWLCLFLACFFTLLVGVFFLL